MNTLVTDRDPVERLAEEFVERYRRGERPAMTEYTAAHPELADRIRELFPAILFVEQMGPARETPGPAAHTVADSPTQLGEYRIVREIGRGGMGIVYEAVQEPLGREVALKVLPQAALANPSYRERFQREAKAAARLHHTNIVPVFGVGEHNGLLYYAMQFIRGQALDAVCREVVRLRHKSTDETETPVSPGPATDLAQSLDTGHFALPSAAMDGGEKPTETGVPQSSPHTELVTGLAPTYVRSVARIGGDVARALAHAHHLGVLHRDIKPANLLLDVQGTVWVTDFGLAKMEGTEELTQSGDVVGTLRYMAPERFQGQADVRSDVYSLGVTLYELLTLRPAFVENDRADLLRQILDDEPKPIRQIDPHIPRDLETIINKAMAKEPRDRYQSAVLLADDLDRFLADRPIQARRTPILERTWRWCRRNPRLARLTGAVAALLLVILVGLPVMLARLWEQRQDTREELWKAQLARAESQRLTTQSGRRFDGLATLDEARNLLPLLRSDPGRELTLRNNYIACLSLPDLGIARQWDGYPPYSTGVTVDPRLEHYARSDCTGTISVFQIAGNRMVTSLPGPGQAAWSLRFSPDGRYIAAGYQCALQTPAIQVQIWDWQQGRSVLDVQSKTACGEAGFSSDSRYVAIGRDEKTLAVYDLADNSKQIRKFNLGSRPEYVAFHPNGQRLAVSQPKGVEIIEFESGKSLEFREHERIPRNLAWRDDGKLLAVASGFGIYLWAENSTRPVAVLRGHEELVTEVAFSHSGDLLASKASDGTVRLWDVAGQRQLVRAPCVYTGCSAMHFAADDSQLGFGSDGSRLWIWDVAAGRECRTFWVRQSGNWQSVMGSFSPDGRMLVAADNSGVHIWDLDASKKLAFVSLLETYSAHFQPDGDAILSTSKQGLHRWPFNADAKPGSQAIGLKETLIDKGPLNLSALSRDGRTLVARCNTNEALVVDLAKPTPPLATLNHPQVCYVAISPDGRIVATGTWYGNGVRLWQLSSGALERELPVPSSATVTFSPDGRWLVAGTDREYQFIRTADWQREHGVAKQPEIGPGDVAFSADGALAVVRHSPTQLRVVDPETGRQLAELQPPEQRTILWHCLSPDGRRLAAASPGGAIHVWDLQLIRRQLAERGLDW